MMKKRSIICCLSVVCMLAITACNDHHNNNDDECTDSPVFVKRAGGDYADEGFACLESVEGQYVIAGYTTSYGTRGRGDYDKNIKYYHDAYIGVFDTQGNAVWSRTLGNFNAFDIARAVAQTADGAYVVVGVTESFGAGGMDALIAKFDSDGTIRWTKTLGGAAVDDGKSVAAASDGGFVVAGDTQSFGAGGTDIFLSKFDSEGAHLWTETLGTARDDAAYSVTLDSNGDIIITGSTDSYTEGNRDVFISKVSAAGKQVWTRTIGGSLTEIGRGVVAVDNGSGQVEGYVVGGIIESSGAGKYDHRLTMFDADGNHLWTRAVGGSGNEYGGTITPTLDSGFVIAGWTKGFGTGERSDMLVSKFDSNGNFVWTNQLGFPDSANPLDMVKCIFTASDGTLVASGESVQPYYPAMPIVKYTPGGDSCLGSHIMPTVTEVTFVAVSQTLVVARQSPVISDQNPTVTSPATEVVTECQTSACPPAEE